MLNRRAVMLTSCALLLPACRAEGREARADLYACEGCEGVYERDPKTLTAEARMAPEGEPGQKLTLSGTVYKSDGQTPAKNVVLYFYQTDADGLYSRGTDESEWSRRHGLLRSWVKTGKDGRYRIETIIPGQYPNLGAPAHIHPTVLEQGRKPYWIDDIVFDGEPGVTDAYKQRMTNKGGSGIVPLMVSTESEAHAERDIILEPHP